MLMLLWLLSVPLNRVLLGGVYGSLEELVVYELGILSVYMEGPDLLDLESDLLFEVADLREESRQFALPRNPAIHVNESVSE
jgi:hypothetical protein